MLKHPCLGEEWLCGTVVIQQRTMSHCLVLLSLDFTNHHVLRCFLTPITHSVILQIPTGAQQFSSILVLTAVKQQNSTMLSTQETSTPVENFYKFIWAKLMTIRMKHHLNGLRKCAREWQFCSFLHTLESEEETWVTRTPLVVDEGGRRSKGGKSLGLHNK